MLCIDWDRYDRIPSVIEELKAEELLIAARVLLEDLHAETLYDEGPYGECKESRYCRSAAQFCLDRLTRRLGYLRGASCDDKADALGHKAIDDRWGIIIRRTQRASLASYRLCGKRRMRLPGTAMARATR